MKRGHNLPIAKHVNDVLTEIARKMGGGVLRVGFLENAKYPDGTPVAAVAFWNEFGHGGHFPSPPRLFFRVMIAKESPEWPAQMGHLAKLYDYDGAKVLAVMGQTIGEELQESIINTNAPELSKTTLILRAKFWSNPQDITASDVVAAQKAAANGEEGAAGTQAKPLVWTHHMLDSVGSEVVKK